MAEGLLGKIVIEDNAWIAMRAILLPGVTVGEGAYVAAAALVNRDVEPYTLVGGVPARKIRDRSRDIEYTCSTSRAGFSAAPFHPARYT
jgi:maltose O-acetyltransferase